MKNSLFTYLIIIPMFFCSRQQKAFGNEVKIRSSIENWQQKLEQTQNNKEIVELKFLTAQAYIELKEYDKAKQNLVQIIALAPNTALAYQKLGDLERTIGRIDKSIELYQKSFKLYQSPPLSLLNNLLKALDQRIQDSSFEIKQSRSQSDRNIATNLLKQDRDLIEQYADLAFDKAGRLLESKDLNSEQELLSAVIAIINVNQIDARPLTPETLQQASSVLGRLNENKSKRLIFTMISWADIDYDNRQQWLTKASYLAQSIGDRYALTYALDALGNYYLESSQTDLALSTAIKSQTIAQSIFAHDSLVRAYSLAARAYEKLERKTEAIESYERAVDALDTLVSTTQYQNIERVINFKKEIEPIYRNSLRLLLDSSSPSQQELNQALAVFGRLRLAQLREYFKDNCLEIGTKSNDSNQSQKINNSAVLNSIILSDRTHFILELPSGEKIHHVRHIKRNELNSKAKQWRDSLTKGYNWSFRSDSHTFYNLIVKPFEAELSKIETIVFVHDGILRNLPMAALYDGEKYLVERWGSVNSLNLKVNSNNKKNARIEEKSEVLAFGLSDPEVGGWGELEGAITEIKVVKDFVGGSIYANEKFTLENFAKQVKEKRYNILHLATHGYFSGSADTSYLLANNSKITAVELEKILKNTKQIVDLLVLSACETAVGSEGSVLGLAGVAARAKVNFVIGSLWQVNDTNQLEIIRQFYQEIAKDPFEKNKIDALAKVQREQIAIQALPQKWAALSLIGGL